jgi:hypothetical protein
MGVETLAGALAEFANVGAGEGRGDGADYQ